MEITKEALGGSKLSHLFPADSSKSRNAGDTTLEVPSIEYLGSMCAKLRVDPVRSGHSKTTQLAVFLECHQQAGELTAKSEDYELIHVGTYLMSTYA